MNVSLTLENPLAGISPAAKQFLARKHKLFINGRWVEPVSGASRPVLDPATGETISTMAEGGPADVDAAVKAARAAFETGPWGKMSTNDRAKISGASAS